MKENKSPENSPEPEQALQDIRQMMEKSSRFISLSGLSGVAAGSFALLGAWLGYQMLHDYYGSYSSRGIFSGDGFSRLKLKLLGLALLVFMAAFLSSFYFTWRRTRRQQGRLWGPVTRRLSWNLALPLLTGAGFILSMLRYDDWAYVSSASLVFYGLALINASRYTLTDIRYLGYCEIILGLVNMSFTGYGLYFWAAGFGLLHIVYGILMWWKYERQ